ncbi:MAG: Na/Pi cotransporter family protein [Spirochaeta sp.]|nr:Na/Pi cotransporter family protein [Spirochaeta sp.]
MVDGFFQVIGSLGLFLFGMKVMSEGVQKAAGDRLQHTLNFMTGNRFIALFTGFIITAFIQSSSATTVMVVSFVNAGLINLTQAIGVIMGANIGTTVTGWIVAIIGFKFKITSIALPAIGIGMLLIFAKRLNKQDWGEALVGFGLLFLGLGFLKNSVPDIRSHPEVLHFLTRFIDLGPLSFIIFVISGTLLTVIVQSSSAAMAITLTMAYAGWIDFPSAAAIVLGENIGTTITATLVSIGTDVNARRAARAHTLFNLIGVLWVATIFPWFLLFIDFLVPGSVTGPDAGIHIPAHLAMFHTLFNVINSVIFILFVPQLASIVKRIVKAPPAEEKRGYVLPFLYTSLQDTPELQIFQTKLEISKFITLVEEMFATFLNVFKHPEMKLAADVKQVAEQEEITDQMQEQLSHYLVGIFRESLNSRSAAQASGLIRIVNELESIGDSCYNLMILAQRRYDKKMNLPEEALKNIAPYTALVTEFMGFIRSHLDKPLPDVDLQKALNLEKRIDASRNSLIKAVQKRLQEGSDVKQELLLLDIVRHIEHIGDYSLNIAEAMRIVY